MNLKSLKIKSFSKIVVLAIVVLFWVSFFSTVNAYENVASTVDTIKTKKPKEWLKQKTWGETECINWYVGWETDWVRCFSLENADIVPNNGQSTTVEEFAGKLIDYMAGVIALFAIVGIMVGGIILMTAYGQEEQIQKGKSIIGYSIIGLIFVILSYVIVSFVQTIIYDIDIYNNAVNMDSSISPDLQNQDTVLDQPDGTVPQNPIDQNLNGEYYS